MKIALSKAKALKAGVKIMTRQEWYDRYLNNQSTGYAMLRGAPIGKVVDGFIVPLNDLDRICSDRKKRSIVGKWCESVNGGGFPSVDLEFYWVD